MVVEIVCPTTKVSHQHKSRTLIPGDLAHTAVLYEVVQSVTVDAEHPAKLVVPTETPLLLVGVLLERAGQSVMVDAQDIIVWVDVS